MEKRKGVWDLINRWRYFRRRGEFLEVTRNVGENKK